MIVNSNSIALTTHQIAALCAFAGKAKPAVDPEDEAEAAVKAALKRRGAKRR